MMKQNKVLFDKDYYNSDDCQIKMLVTPLSIYEKRIFYSIVEFEPSEMTDLSEVLATQKIISVIQENYESYDSSIILQDIERLTYTASLLSFALENLSKLVILTGSQIPLTEMKNDAASNIVGALTMAGHFVIPEVCIYCRDKLYRGNRTMMVTPHAFDPFTSPHLPPLATLGIDIRVKWELLISCTSTHEPLHVHKDLSSRIVLIKYSPTICDLLRFMIQKTDVEAVVVQGLENSNQINNNLRLIAVLEQAYEKGVLVVAVSASLKGHVDFTPETFQTIKYSSKDERELIVSGADMTAETCIAKLCCLLRKGLSRNEIKKLMKINLKGEMIGEEKGSCFPERLNDENTNQMLLKCVLDVVNKKISLRKYLLPKLINLAASMSYAQILRKFVVLNGKVESPDEKGRTPLHFAARDGNQEITALLLKIGMLLKFLFQSYKIL
eukprot:TRINITY_DN13052_c0_g1_i2.p1 TRINITY_DN13052_c0_g1~~TRINITY_DN13052_c0_g1_i2.p1  ORF type:complete len:441 (+),score=44.82 TRINITY_DN13052_c0_g1_i2:79-1401(+)